MLQSPRSPGTVPTDAREAPPGVDAYVRRFAEIWADPRGAESFTDRFMEYVDPEIRLIQPWLFYPPGRGIEAFKRQFHRYFDGLPDLTGEVVRWAAAGDTVWIELELTCWHDRRPLSFRVVDRTVLRDGRAIERRVFGDPLPLFLGVLRRPWAWPRAVRAYLPW